MNYVRASSQSPITDSVVLDMRDLAKREGLTATAIADIYGIDRTTAGRIITRRTWSHVPEPKTVQGYVVYPDGRVYSKAAARFLNTTVGRDGQVYVELRTNDRRERVAVALLVAKAFLGTKSKAISYVDGDPSNAHFTNLVINK